MQQVYREPPPDGCSELVHGVLLVFVRFKGRINYLTHFRKILRFHRPCCQLDKPPRRKPSDALPRSLAVADQLIQRKHLDTLHAGLTKFVQRPLLPTPKSARPVSGLGDKLCDGHMLGLANPQRRGNHCRKHLSKRTEIVLTDPPGEFQQGFIKQAHRIENT